MQDFLPLKALGDRICIIGPSNSGKSTIARALGWKLDCPAYYLDQFYHLPHTNWVQRPKEEFWALHDEAISGERWVMEGNYSSAMPKRFSRATGLIWLDAPVPVSLLRYIRRTHFDRDRAGHLDGALDSVKWELIRYIAFAQPKNRIKYRDLLADYDFPILEIHSPRLLNQYYRHWDLQRNSVSRP